MYQMPSSTPTNLIGNPRLLFLYKDLSENNKLVTPIFREFGDEISNNKIVSPEIDSSGTRMIFSEFPANLDEFWKQVLSGTITSGRKRQYIIEDENRFIQFFKSLIH